MKALSIRQPWAHAIVHLGKDVENRDWDTRYRGPILVHAAKGMTKAEYQSAWFFIETISRRAGIGKQPTQVELLRGGIIGVADLVDVVVRSDSPWFVGPFGFVLRNVRPLPFIPCKGALGFFDVPREVLSRVIA
jgi:hypothetical protein